MKTIRRLTTLTGISLMLLGLLATGARAQDFSTTVLSGSFTLPFNARWGAMTLPAGDYALYYGRMSSEGAYMVEVVGKEEGSPHGFVLVRTQNPSAATISEIICVREGSTGVVQSLQIPEIGEILYFAMPRSGKVHAGGLYGSRNTLLAEAPMTFKRIPVALSAK